jgi:multidrug resistance efflux pump
LTPDSNRCLIHLFDPTRETPPVTRRTLARLLLAAGLVGAVVYYVVRGRGDPVVLTGVVTTNDVIVSSQVGGQIGTLLVAEGDAVTRGQLLAVMAPDELRADSAYYKDAAQGATSSVQQNEAALRYEQQQTDSQVRQAQAALAAAEAMQASTAADLENASLVLDRSQKLFKEGVVSNEEFDQARTTYNGLKERVASLGKQADSARAAVELARSHAEQVTMRRSQLEASRYASAAAADQQRKADVRLAYTEIRSPIDGYVEVRAARQGEVVTAGQPILTLVNPDDFWIRADVEETYVDQVRVGDHLAIRLPSGAQLDGTVFYRGVDAGFATQRDVSRSKRDIKTFELRLRADNHDRRLAVGMTAYVTLPALR